MKDESIVALDGASRLAVTCVDCTSAADELAHGHLAGPAAARVLGEALACAAVLGAECSEDAETVTWRLDAPGPLQGFLVEAAAAGTLRGYTKRKVLDDFDGMGPCADTAILGDSGTFQVIRSIPGAIISSGSVAVPLPKRGALAAGLDAYFAQSLQRRVRTAFACVCGDDGKVVFARGIAVECPPDGDAAAYAQVAQSFDSGAAAKALAVGAAAPRTLLKKLGLPQAALRSTRPLSFACRCSAERAAATLAALPKDERATLPPTVDITCHMCGRTWTVTTGA